MDTLISFAARVMNATGDVWLQDGNEQMPLIAGMTLATGTLLHTGSHGTALVQLTSGHELGLGPDQTLLLDADVLADAGVDTSEWALDARANAAMVTEWLVPDTGNALSLAGVLDAPGDSLDHLLQTGTPHPAHAGDMHQLMMAGIGDDGIACLLRSLYGPEQG
ncbi:MAG: hypothetical protein WBJ03_08370 [Moraxellaceae bacterium]